MDTQAGYSQDLRTHELGNGKGGSTENSPPAQSLEESWLIGREDLRSRATLATTANNNPLESFREKSDRQPYSSFELGSNAKARLTENAVFSHSENSSLRRLLNAKPADRVLIIDADSSTRGSLSTYLNKYGLRVDAVSSGRQMRAALEDAGPFDLIILDPMLPGENGLNLCRDLQSGKFRDVPIVMLTTLHEEADRILGLEMGADDYVAKPCSLRELLARLRAILRRTRKLPPNIRPTEDAKLLRFGQWQVDTVDRSLRDENDVMVALSGAQYRLLKVFLDHPKKVLSRDQLLGFTQGREADLFDRSIDLLVSRLRQSLREDARKPRFIKTVRSEGYVFSATVEARDDCRFA